jgi:4-amino-4-deoxy-L-arabinose transferase-like glycosyltransferase
MLRETGMIGAEPGAFSGGGGLSGGGTAPGTWTEGRIAAAGFLVFLAAWTVHGAIAEADKSLHYDLLEAYAWGKEFQLGYNQHGPFWAWIAGGWFTLFPTTNASFILLEALNTTLGLYGAWKLNGLFAKGWTRHTATLLLLATPFYTFMAYKYNANTIFISLWPWTLYFFVKSVDEMKLRDALLFGVLAGFCILSKYYAAILLMTCTFSLIVHPRGREYVFSALPWVSAAVFSVLVLPHVLWALRSDAPPVAYAVGLTGNSWQFTFHYVGKFLADLALDFSPLLVIFLLAWWSSSAASQAGAAQRLPPSRQRFLAVLVLTPPLLTLLFGVAFRLKLVLIMAVGTFPLVPLFLTQYMPPLDGWRLFRLAAAVAIAVTVLAAAGAPFERAAMAQKAGSSFLEPRQELAQRATELWHAETNTSLHYAGGTARYANGISFYSDDHPSSLVDLSYAKALWVTPAKIKQYGLLIACAHGDTECLGKAAGFLSGNWKQTTIKIVRTIGTRQMPEAGFDIFIIPPQAA